MKDRSNTEVVQPIMSSGTLTRSSAATSSAFSSAGCSRVRQRVEAVEDEDPGARQTKLNDLNY